MKLPRKINPDNLIESIVEIRMNPITAQELWAGKLFQSIGMLGWSYVPTPKTNSSTPFYGLFIKDDLRFTIQENGIVFNCSLKKYIGWERYRTEIKNVIEKIKMLSLIDYIDRIQIRYISEFKNVDLKDCVSNDIISCKDKFRCQIVKLEKSEGDTKVFIQLTNSRRNGTSSSFFDVNVFESFERTDSIEKAMKALDDAHVKEKETFFELLDKSFLQNLNPEY